MLLILFFGSASSRLLMGSCTPARAITRSSFFLPTDLGAEPLTPQHFARLIGAPDGVALGERTPDHFLSNHIETSDPWDVETQRIRPRYERLKALLKENLRDVRVFRVGEIQVRCYIVGKDEQGNLAGLATTAVET